MTSNEIREKFLKFFEKKGHKRVASSSLVPSNDPTLFFTNAGMVPFKDIFTGAKKAPYKTATSSQKCLRVSGKHNDLENVGRTPRHHTFFEMLGNFSFGDYFKKEAIVYAWEFLTETVSLPPDALWITVYKDDREASDIWKREIGIPSGRIIGCGEEDNFWSMGDTGPCGPCSEIHVDLKAFEMMRGSGFASPSESPGGMGEASGQSPIMMRNPSTHPDDFMEIWNLVFMQFNRDDQGKMSPLPKPSIDTGMGLERLAALLQNKRSNFETDLFSPLIEFISHRTNKTYGTHVENDISMRVVADHARAAAFLVSDGVMPANEGRGYVLRRIMRRAIRHGRMLGLHDPFFHFVTSCLVEQMAKPYPDLARNKAFVAKVIASEEEKFLETLDKGMTMIEEAIGELKKKREKVLSGGLAFKLYDTFGFPLDLTQIILEEQGLAVDIKTFEKQMEGQKNKARQNWRGSGAQKIGEIYHDMARKKKKTLFVGYESLVGESVLTEILLNGEPTEEVSEGMTVEVFVEETPFYGESGGQVGDHGIIESKKGYFEVSDTQKPVEGVVAHIGRVTRGKIKVGDKVRLTVSSEWRRPTMLNHTATHILHAALREILGEHVKQAGSLVEPERLRFDFSHYEALTTEQIETIERRVNEVILANYPVAKEEMSLKEANKRGAIAFFGDKYGDRVRVVSVGPYSMEFCGGTHLNFSGEIGLLKITSESSVASGVRRIEAVTGLKAFQKFQELEKNVGEWASLLKTTPDDFSVRIKKMLEKVRDLEGEVSRLKTKLASGYGGDDYLKKVREINGVKLLTLEVDIDEPKALREFSDQVKNRLGTGIAVIGSKAGGKVALIVTVSPDLTAKYNAGKLISEIAAIVGGKGGGRADMAQAGGPKIEKLTEALEKINHLI